MSEWKRYQQLLRRERERIMIEKEPEDMKNELNSNNNLMIIKAYGCFR